MKLTGCVIIFIHVLLVAYSATRHTPVVDEVGHLPAGLSHWHLRRFDLYNVNPPLVRLVATLPAFLTNEPIDFAGYQTLPRYRPEFGIGTRWINAHPDRFMPVYITARWACLPFALLGAVTCFLWARDLYGENAGLAALCLWCFSPTVLGHASLITPDAGAAAVGVAACYTFWRWLHRSTLKRAVLAGVLLGLTLLCKLTWVVLLPLFCAAWAVFRWPGRPVNSFDGRDSKPESESESDADDGVRVTYGRDCGQLLLVFFVAWWVICNGYLWEDVFQPLGRFDFYSESLSGQKLDASAGEVGNRFRGTILEHVPFPLPRNILQGMDYVKFEYERGYDSYLRGEEKHGGWWYYYLYAMLVKMPVGTLTLLGFSSLPLAHSVCLTLQRRPTDVPLRDELFLLAPAVAVLGLVSSQTGFNHHLRYVLPAFPFLFIFAGRTALLLNAPRHWLKVVPPLCVLATIVSSLTIYPHSLSYFNEPSGGSINGWRHLDKSNVDWGQDLLLVKEWVQQHPEATPLYVYPSGFVSAKAMGIEAEFPSRTPPEIRAHERLKKEYSPGWYIVGLTRLVDGDSACHEFLRTEPVDYIGYSMRVYFLPGHE